MNNKFTFLTIILIYLFNNTGIAQDVMVIGYNYDSPDGVTLLALKDIPDTQPIFLTETDYDATNNDFNRDGTNDGTWHVTWTGTWLKGTLIRFEESGPSTNTFIATSSTNGPASPAAISPYGDAISFSNEGFSVFTASNVTDPDNTVTEIYSFVEHNDASADPNPNDDGNCPCSTGFIEVDHGSSTTDHGQFRPALRSGTVTNADLMSNANWDLSGVNITLDLTEFTDIVLPVELTWFHAQKDDQQVEVEWETFTELNNEYFSIEHSLDAENFEPIGKVEGAGNSFEPLFYRFMHNTPATGINYYRLKQVDFNGSFSYSQIVPIEFRNENEEVSVYPNPFKQTVTLQLPESNSNFSANQDWTVEVVDVYGKIVHNLLIPASVITTDLDLSRLYGGIYFIRTIDAERNVLNTVRVVKQ